MAGREFSAWLTAIQKEEGQARTQALALLGYLRDLPEAELHMLDSGHFAVEDSLDEIVAHIKRFHAEQADGRAGVGTVEPAGSTR